MSGKKQEKKASDIFLDAEHDAYRNNPLNEIDTDFYSGTSPDI